MIDDKKIVVVTPAGRKQYLEILIPFVLRDRGIIDEYQLWLNTTNEDDVKYIRSLEDSFPGFIKIIEPDPLIPIVDNQKGYSIYQFFKGCIQPGTVYIRLDDDIIYIDKGSIEALARFRINNPQYFLVYGNIVNNAICSHLHQRYGLIDYYHGTVAYWFLDDVGWKKPEFAEYCHRWFFHHYQEGKQSRYKIFERWELNIFERVSINVISWLGEEFASFDGVVGVDEESWLSQEKPLSLTKMNCIFGNCLFVHYAFYSQREYLDTTNALNLYKKIVELELKELSDEEKLLYVLNVVLTSPIEKIKDVEFVEYIIKQAGLYPDSRPIYGKDEEFSNKKRGSWQIPSQLASFIVYMMKFNIATYLDVGVFCGWTCSLISAFLYRINPSLKVIAIDPQNWWNLYPEISNILPIEYQNKTSDDYKSRKYDLVFIDGNHEYSSVKQDYDNVGKFAMVCAFHDINDDYIRFCPHQMGGVPKFWEELKSSKKVFREFCSHSEGKNVMGIGALLQQ